MPHQRCQTRPLDGDCHGWPLKMILRQSLKISIPVESCRSPEFRVGTYCRRWCFGWSMISSPSRRPLTEVTNCCRGRSTEGIRSHNYSELRPHQVSFLVGSAITIPNATRGHAEDCYQPEACCYPYNDHCPEQHTSNRTNVDAIWGIRMPAPLALPVMSATVAPAAQA